MANTTDTALAITAVGQSMVAYQFFLPPLHVVRKKSDKATQADVHLGIMAAGAVSLGSAFLLSQLSGNRTPIYASLLILVTVASVYEMAALKTGVME